MIYDEQKQMVTAMDTLDPMRCSTAEALGVAFAAIDREALIEKAAKALYGVGWSKEGCEVGAEKVLVAAGIIPERSR